MRAGRVTEYPILRARIAARLGCVPAPSHGIYHLPTRSHCCAFAAHPTTRRGAQARNRASPQRPAPRRPARGLPPTNIAHWNLAVLLNPTRTLHQTLNKLIQNKISHIIPVYDHDSYTNATIMKVKCAMFVALWSRGRVPHSSESEFPPDTLHNHGFHWD